MVQYLSMVTTAVMVIGVSTPRTHGKAQTIERWGMFELTIPNPRSYANPFTDVTLQASFTSPSGQQISVYGFYDGEQTWGLRFMPDREGPWSYEAKFSDSAAGTTGSFQCTKGKLHGPLQVCKNNPLWFEFADGTPFYLLGFHLWRPDALEEATLVKTLDFLKAQGFNTLLGPHLEARCTAWEHTPEGKPNFTRLNLTVWQGLDRVLRLTAERQMVLIPFAILGGTNRIPAPRDEAGRDLLLRYWVARWGGFWNTTYQPVSEWEEGYRQAEILHIGQHLHDLDRGQHLISLHSLRAGSEALQRAPWFAYHTVQDKLGEHTGQNKQVKGNKDPAKFAWLAELYRRVPKPILAHECVWEGDFYQGESGLDVDNLRKGAWVIALNGGQIAYADMVMSPHRYLRREDMDTGVTFSELGTTMQPNGWLYPTLAYLAGLMRSLPFQHLTAHPELSSSGICLAQPTQEYVVYTLNGGQVVTDLTTAKGSFIARWFNPRTGQFGKPLEVKGNAKVPFPAPDENDWVLHIKRRK